MIRGVGQSLRIRKIRPWWSVLKLWPTTGSRVGLRGSFVRRPGTIPSFRWRKTAMHLRWWKMSSVWVTRGRPKLTIKLISSEVISSPTKLIWRTSVVRRRGSPVWKFLTGPSHWWWLSWGLTRPLIPRRFSPSPILLPVLANSSSPRITNHHPWISRLIIHPPIDIGILMLQFRLKSPLIFVGRPPFSIANPLPAEGTLMTPITELPRWRWPPRRKVPQIWPTKITNTFWSHPLLSVVRRVSKPRWWSLWV